MVDQARKFRMLAVLAWLLALPAGAVAQVTLGANAGVALSSLEGDDVDDVWGRSDGLVAGLYLGFPVSDVFSLAPGLYYAQKGAEAQVGPLEEELELAYLEVPLLGVFRVTAPERRLGVSLFLGPSLAFEISCEVEVEVSEDDGESAACDDDPDDERRKVDFGAIFGAGISLPLTDGFAATLSAGLDFGLRSLDGSSEGNDIKNSMWFVTLGAAFPLGS